MTLEQYATDICERGQKALASGDFVQSALLFERLAREVKAHGMAMKHGVGKPFTAPRAS